MPHPDSELHAQSVIRFHDRQVQTRDWPVLSRPPARRRMQARRVEACAEHVRICAARLERLLAQRHDLASCLDALLADARAGR
jgi:hypothetical protein